MPHKISHVNMSSFSSGKQIDVRIEDDQLSLCGMKTEPQERLGKLSHVDSSLEPELPEQDIPAVDVKSEPVALSYVDSVEHEYSGESFVNCHFMAATSTSDHEDEADSENYFLPNTRGTVKRKRTRNEVLWKKKNAKMCRNRGLQYVSLKTHKVVPAKIRGRGCACAVKSETANLKWCEYHKLTDEVKDKLFTEFYKLGDYNAQNAFLFGLVFRRQCNRIYEFKRRQSDESRRKFSFMYSVKDANGDTVRVCAKAFCDIFAISRKRLSTARGDRKAIDKSEFENINEGNESNNDSKSNHCEPEIVLTKFGPHLDCRGRHGKQKSRKEEFGS